MLWVKEMSGGSHLRLVAVQLLSRQVKDGYCSTMVLQEHVMVMYTLSVVQSLILIILQSLSTDVRHSFLHLKSGMRREDLFLMYASLVQLFMIQRQEESLFTTALQTAM